MTTNLKQVFAKLNNRSNLVRWLVFVFLPLLIGAVFYRYYRPKHTAIFGESNVLESPLPVMVTQSLPSLLWSFALTAAFCLIWRPVTKLAAFYITGLTAVVSILFEVWQAADIGIGTFDKSDCIFSILGCLVSALIFHKTVVHENLD